MILGPEVHVARDRSNTYFVELLFITEENVACSDHFYFNFEKLLKLFPILTASDKVRLFDADLIDFIDVYFCTPENTEWYSLISIAYVDDSSVFHYFDFDLNYLRQHRPELLLWGSLCH